MYEQHGGIVPGLVNRNGHGNLAACKNTSGWGGARIKDVMVADVGRWLHADAVSTKNSTTRDLIVQIAGESIDSSDGEFSDDE